MKAAMQGADMRRGARSAHDAIDAAAYAAIFGLGALLFWLSRVHPAAMPVWAPWDFSSPEYLVTALLLYWFWRGLARLPVAERPARWRRVCFVLGVAAIWIVLQTRFEYWSQHMFFLNRVQHVVMHHLGPFLIGLGCAGGAIKRGMPAFLQRAVEHRLVTIPMRVLQQPVVASVLFAGLFYFWLVPSIHFIAMIDHRLYAVMNWSMVLDGVLFWVMVLDPRPSPPARVSYGVRAAMSFAVMFPQIALGAFITFSRQDLYPFYDLCGRLFPSMDALTDQHIGGIILWIPPAMMSVIGVLVVINALRLYEESHMETDHDAAALAALARSWTGR